MKRKLCPTPVFNRTDMHGYPNKFLIKEGYSSEIHWHTYENTQCACGSSILKYSGIHELYKKCKDCGSYVLSQFIVEEQLDLLYGKAYWYEHQKAIGLPNIEERYHNDINDRIPTWIAKITTITPLPANVLEVGCAHGRLLQELTTKGYICEGVEYNQEVMKVAENLSNIVVHNEIPDDKFSIVVANDVLEHVYRPLEFMETISTRLATGGKIFTQIPMSTNLEALPKVMRPYFHTFIYSEKCLNILASKSGLTIDSISEGLFGTYDVVWSVRGVNKFYCAKSTLAGKVSIKNTINHILTKVKKLF